jgi:hypothetical protein
MLERRRGRSATGRAPVAGALLRIAAAAFTLEACLPSQGPVPGANSPLAPVERAYQVARYWDDQLRLTQSLGQDTTPAGVPASLVRDSLRLYGARFNLLLDDQRRGLFSPEDERALAILREARGIALTSLDSVTVPPEAGIPDSLTLLTDSVLAAYQRAANTIVVDHDTLNRLAILGLLPRTGDSAQRRRLFLALQPVWQSVNGSDDPRSPYRTLLRLRRKAWGDSASPIEQKGPALGLDASQVEGWIVGALEAWRAAVPDTLLEPWDWYYRTGEASRRLGPRLPTIPDMRRVNDTYYGTLGASPARLRIRYDLEARPGKYPVAFTDFGIRNRWIEGRFVPGEPWVFTSYLAGSLDNLAELLHESGHAIHIAAIRTRPAYADWPDNDTFTEALADLPALELYEPAWQLRFLGDSVALGESLRAKYASIVFDLAWALFEIRVHRTPDADPNRVWTEITSNYLRIRAHPEWSWWAMRGQLIDGPGYLVNYALGAFLVADMRARVAERWGNFTTADSLTYPRLSAAIYRFGRERPARQVLEDFLGRPARPDALLADLARMSR